jgi:coenzyme F420-0:L-glutamate ligase / coenzyme F420-1:gamma-L-glutamate ligase
MSPPPDLHAFLRSRRSIRRFLPDAVSDSVLERILATATSAPSAHNRQPWRFAILIKDSSKSALAAALAERFRADLERDGLPEDQVEARVERSRTRIASAPVVVILCMDVSEMDQYPDASRADAERIMAIQSTANAGLMLLLGVHAEGLGGVWNCAPLFAPEVVKAALDLPASWEPQALLMAGNAADAPQSPPRKSLREVSVFV